MWELDSKESWAPKNWCFWTVVLEKTLESKEILKDPKGKSILNIHSKDWYWSWNSNTLATWCEELTHLKRPCYWERLRAGGEGDNRGWSGCMASLTQWRWVWLNSGSWQWTGKPWGGKKLDMTEQLNWTELNWLTNMSPMFPAQLLKTFPTFVSMEFSVSVPHYNSLNKVFLVWFTLTNSMLTFTELNTWY